MPEPEAPKGKKGRPPGAPQPYPDGPMDTWLEGLSPTALNLLDAARRILVTDGYSGVTLEAVALEAGEDRATIKRHFGSKAGLIHASSTSSATTSSRRSTSEQKRCRPARNGPT